MSRAGLTELVSQLRAGPESPRLRATRSRGRIGPAAGMLQHAMAQTPEAAPAAAGRRRIDRAATREEILASSRIIGPLEPAQRAARSSTPDDRFRHDDA